VKETNSLDPKDAATRPKNVAYIFQQQPIALLCYILNVIDYYPALETAVHRQEVDIALRQR